MADNFLENQYNEYLKQKAAKEAAKHAAWRKRLQAYKEKLEQEKLQLQQKENSEK